GSAYDGIGLHLELGAESFAFFLGTGSGLLERFDARATSHHDYVAGVRFFSGDLDEFFFSIQAIFVAHHDGTRQQPEFVKALSMTAGWRWRFGPHLIELGFGPMASSDQSRDVPPIPTLEATLAYGFRF